MPAIAQPKLIATVLPWLLLMLFQGMARDAEPKIPGKPVDASFLVIEGSADTLEYIPFIAGSESLPFKKLRGRVATRPEETYWVRLDFQGWEKEMSSRPLWILQTGVFNEAEAYPGGYLPGPLNR